MIRSELVTRLAAQNPHLYQHEAEAVVSAILDRIADALMTGDRVELRDFGVFEVRRHEARRGRNPKTGQPVDVSAKTVVRFYEGRAMRGRLNQRSEDIAEIPCRRRAS